MPTLQIQKKKNERFRKCLEYFICVAVVVVVVVDVVQGRLYKLRDRRRVPTCS